MLSIKVLGPGCANCERVETVARQAVGQLGVPAKVEKLKDPADFARYGLLYTPGLVVNEKLVSAGRVPEVAECVTFITNAMMEAETLGES